MNWEYLHLIKGNNMNIAYYPPAFSLNIINDMTYSILIMLKEKKTIDEISMQSGMNIADLQTILQQLEKTFSYKENTLQESPEKDDHTVGRITLHVSNDCNLRCKYCYAEGGSYHQKRGKMSIHTAKQFVDFCINNFSNVEQVVFFGGEPMLNFEVMKTICNIFKKYFATHKSTFMPKFGIITNGTILNKEILDFIQNNLSFVTVSIDGIADLNDANRIFQNGRGSYERIAKFIHTVKEKTNVPLRFEATFTHYHLDKKQTPQNVADSLSKEFGISGTVINELHIDDKDFINYWNDFDFEKIDLKSLENLPIGFDYILKALVKKEKRNICAISKHTFAVAADGEIYPCHMNNGEKQNSLGNISGKNIFHDKDDFQTVSSFTLKDNNKCKQCWANNLCGGCAMKWFYDKKNKCYQQYPNAELCEWSQKYFEKILLMIAYIRRNPLLWATLIQKVADNNL